MPLPESQLHSAAAAAFDRKMKCNSGAWVTTSLTSGLSLLRDETLKRVYDEVEVNVGFDSMVMAVSPVQIRKRAQLEIEIYLTAESAKYVERKESLSDPAWYADWLATLRMPKMIADEKVQKRLHGYLEKSPDERRMRFARVLEQTAREAVHAPLVLYRLLPLAAEIVTAVALGDVFDPTESRNQQTAWLPAISDCQECLGRPLDNGEQCKQCGNPVWHYRWLQSAD